MQFYLEQYFDILINTRDLNVIEQLMPSINLDKTNQILDELIKKLESELALAIEYEDDDYKNHLNQIIKMIQSKKEKELVFEESKTNENILIFGPNFMKSVKQLEDSQNYKPILTAINNLTSKDWMEGNSMNSKKYKRLHGVASGLSEVKVFPIRLIHTKINEDFWYVSEVMDKEGNNTKRQQETLARLCEASKEAVSKIISDFSQNGEINYELLKQYSNQSKIGIIEELSKWEVQKDEKRV